MQTVLTALCFDAEAVLKAFVRMSTGDDLRFGATDVYILLAMDDVTAVALQSIDYKRTGEKNLNTCEVKMLLLLSVR